MQMNNTSFFKKLLRFFFGNIFLKCTGGSFGGRNLLMRLLSWLQRAFFCLIYIKVRFPSVSSNKSGSTTERNGPASTE